jgi:hypothetical protein
MYCIFFVRLKLSKQSNVDLLNSDLYCGILWTFSILDLSSLNLSMPDLSSPIFRLRTFSFLTYCRCAVFFLPETAKGRSSFSFGSRILLKFILKTYQTANPRLTLNASSSSLLTKRLNFKGQCHKIFDFRFFMNQFSQAPEYIIRAFQKLAPVANGKIFNEKSFHYFF